MQGDHIMPLTHKKNNIERVISPDKSDNPKQIKYLNKTLQVPKRQKTSYKPPQTYYKINQKPINCHFEYSLNNYQAQRRQKSRFPSKTNTIDKHSNPSLDKSKANNGFWGCIVPKHKETMMNKKLNIELEKANKISNQLFANKGKPKRKSVSQQQSKLEKQNSQLLLNKYIYRKYNSLQKQLIGQKAKETNPPILAPRQENDVIACDCQELETIALKLKQDRERRKWQQPQTQFIKKLKKYSETNFNVFQTLNTTNQVKSTQITEQSDLGIFFTNDNFLEHRSMLKQQSNVLEIKQQWEKQQNSHTSYKIEKYHQEETPQRSKIKQLTELIRWRSRLIHKIQEKTQEIKNNYSLNKF